jgi:hypothetical protein
LSGDVANHLIYAGGDSGNVDLIDATSLSVIDALDLSPPVKYGIDRSEFDPGRRTLFFSSFGRQGFCSGTDVTAASPDIQHGSTKAFTNVTRYGLGPMSLDASTGAAYVGEIICRQDTNFAGHIFRLVPTQ